MCPKCFPQYFPEERQGLEHISPRFRACSRWRVAVDDQPYNNVYEAHAGNNGSIWYTGKEKCECGSGFPNMGLAAGAVEMYHEAHPSKIVFDDGSSKLITCPEMHLGPYHLYEPPTNPLTEARNALKLLITTAEGELQQLDEISNGSE